MNSKILKALGSLFFALNLEKLFSFLSDEKYLKLLYRMHIGKKLNLSNPQTFNEKLQWLKLNNQKDEYTMMVDKYLVREYIKRTIGEEYLIPLIGVWDKPEEIDFDSLPSRFVLKCNHNSGTGMCICKDKRKLDYEKVKSDLKKGLAENYDKYNREWPYKNVRRKIICEEYMEDENGELKDYKFMAFNGEVKCSFVGSDRFSPEGLHITFYDNDWNIMPFERHYPCSNSPLPCPECFEEMKKLAAKLSKNIPFIRVDFYEIQGKVYFGELTFFPGSGFEEFTPNSWDYELGSWIDLSKVEK